MHRPRGVRMRRSTVPTSPTPGGRRSHAASGILGGPVDAPARLRAAYARLPATTGLQATHRASGFRGTVLRCEGPGVFLRGATGLERLFPLETGAFSVDGQAVTLIRPVTADPRQAPTRTASGSRAVANQRARTARAARIYVEGVHDAELVEAVWGDDLRVEGVVVERLDGIDHLDDAIRDFAPGARRRLGVLVDHLVPGSKEARIAASIANPHVLVTGTPYVDVWQAIRPKVLGIDAWPVIPKGESWKDGIARAFGEPNTGRLWKQLLVKVGSFADLEPPFVGAVEELIDFVTAGDGT